VTPRHLTFRREGAVEYLTLNRPELRNALNDELIAELTSWAESAHRDPDIRVVVLAGEGKAFCAGADVAWMAKTAAYTEAQNLRDAEALSHVFALLDTLPMPLIGSIQGAALGGGSGLAAVCDIAIAEEQTVFGFPEVKLGILPAIISPFVIRRIGPSAARELFLTGARFSAARAREIGLVHVVVTGAKRHETTQGYVDEILTGGPEAIAATKALIREVSGTIGDDVRAITARAIASRRVSAEGQEGLRAFLEKRPQSWKP